MKLHGLKPPKYCISLSQINTHTIKNPYSICTLAVRWSFFIKILFLRYKNHFFGIYKCRWRMRTNVTGIILSPFPTHVGVILVLIAAFKLHKSFPHTCGGDPKFQKGSDPMQLIHEFSWLWKGIAIIALASAMVFIAAFKLHKEEYKIEIVCIILIVTILICIIAMILCARVPMPI